MSPARRLSYLDDPPPAGEPKFHALPGGARLAWDEFGDPAGEPLIYYHGWPSSRLQARLAHHLALERGLRVIAMDRPGMGQSTRIDGRQLGDWGPVLEHFLAALGVERFVQLGVSGGGPYVLAAADYFGPRVAGSAVLCGAVPLAGMSRRGLHPIYRLLIPLRRLPAAAFAPVVVVGRGCARGDFNRLPLSLLIRSLPDEDRAVLRANPAAVPTFLESFREGIRQGARGVLGDAEIYMSAWGLDLAAQRGEVRYWHGRQDRNIPLSLVEEFVARVRGASLVVDEEQGHFSLALVRAPDALDYLVARMRR